MIGIQYGISGLIFLFFGFCLMMLMRWQLAYPGQALPVIGKWLPHMFGPEHGGRHDDAGVLQLVRRDARHDHDLPRHRADGVRGFRQFRRAAANRRARHDFPEDQHGELLGFFVGGVIMMVSFFVPGGAAKGGWTSYTPLADISDTGPGHNPIFNGQTLWLIGFIFLITSSLLGAVNFIATIIQLRAKGMTWMRLPFFVWAQFVTAFLLLLAFPPLEAAVVMQLMDRVARDQFLPAERPGREWCAGMHISGGGSPLLWQHLFWFLGHPGSLRVDSAGHGHRRRNHREQHPQAALGL